MRFAVLILMIASSVFAADPVPAERLRYGGTWENMVGVSGGIPERTTINTTLPTSSTAAQINSAIAACTAGEVVLLDAGEFVISDRINIAKSGVTLRGATNANGVPTTRIRWTSNTGIIINTASGWDVSDSGQFTTRTISSGASRGSTTVTLTAAPTGLTTDRLMWISAPASTDVTGNGWSLWFGTDPFTQTVKVTGVSGNDVTFTPALNADFLSGTLRVHYRSSGSQISLSGIESLALTNSNGAGNHYIQFYGTDECWAKNIQTYDVQASVYHCYMYASFRTEVRHCDMAHMRDLGSSTYCILGVHSSDWLIVDNYFHDIPNVMPMMGMNGGAFAYNFATNFPYVDADWLSQIVFPHGSQIHYVIFEGNVSPAHYIDNGAGSRNLLFFRERMRGWDGNGPKANNTQCITTETAADGRQYNLTIAGCVMGDNTYGHSFGEIYDLDATTDATDLRFKNYNTADDGVHSGEELGGGDALVTSYIYSSKPAWFGDRPWPPIDPDNYAQSNGDAIPAMYRAYNNGADPPAESGGGDIPAVTGSSSSPKGFNRR